MAAYLAPSLSVLRDEINARWPKRDRASDGWIGDAAHQKGQSDHNPNGRGSVNALDVDKDGIGPMVVVRAAIGHPSTEYVIYNRQIWTRSSGFKPARYTGSNPHDKHLHVSVRQTRAAEQDRRPWGIAGEDDDMSWTEQVTSTAGTRKPAGVLLGDAADRTYQIRNSDLPAISRQLAQVLANQQAMAGTDWVNEQQIIDGVLAGLGGRDLDEVVEVLVAAMGPDRASELGRRLTPTGPAS